MAESLRDAAVALVNHGFRLIPLRGKRPATVNGLKDWSDDPEMIGTYIDNHPGVNIGAVMGEGLVAIDVDRDDNLGYDGNESIMAWEREYGPLPETASFITGRGGYQMIYRVDRHVSPATNGELHVDIRGDGSYSVMPPSVHPDTKRRYAWENDIEDFGIADADENVYALIEHVRGHAEGDFEKFEMPDEVTEGEGRNNKLFKQGASWQALEWSDEAIVYGLRYINEHNFKPPLDDDERDKTINSVLRLSKGKSEKFRDESASDEIEHIDVDDIPPLKPELIEGVLRRGGVMMLGGASKAGKTFMLMQLTQALATGLKWLCFDCARSKVLYVNLEVDSAEFAHRFRAVYDHSYTSDVKPILHDNIGIMNLRGKVRGMERLVDKLIAEVKGEYDVVIIDPSYKVIDGDENAAKDVGMFTNELDRLATELDASVIYCHHHSKGFKGESRSMDRVSGSGVFARHADAIVDCIELEVDEELRDDLEIGNSPCFRLEFTTRSFKQPDDIETVFEYPKHRMFEEGELEDCRPFTPAVAGGKKSGERRSEKKAEKMAEVEGLARELLDDGREIRVVDLARLCSINRVTCRKYIDEIDVLRRVRKGRDDWVEYI